MEKYKNFKKSHQDDTDYYGQKRKKNKFEEKSRYSDEKNYRRSKYDKKTEYSEDRAENHGNYSSHKYNNDRDNMHSKHEAGTSKDDNYYSRRQRDSLEDPESEFTYSKYKHDLNKIFSSYPLIQDTNEFWQFVKKFELMEKKKNVSPSKKNKVVLNSIGIPEEYNGTHCLNFTLNYKDEELFINVPKSKELTMGRLEKFKQIIIIYMDFKQKEKFQKLKKLRNDQANLPVAQYKNEIIEAVKNERVVIIAGDTGCGKSTQVPQYLYQANFGKIACTQPRRLACIALAKRVAYESLNENRNEIGYQIRFEKQRNQNTKITFITEGLLLRQVSGESGISQYDVVILDEVHERHLHGDFLLGIMKCILHQRSDIKLVLMSATINIELFSNYFSQEDVKVLQVPGRLFPIQLIYRPVMVVDKYSKAERFNPSPYIQIMQIIDKTYSATERGDLLIFLSGMSEITAVVDAAKEYCKKENNWIVLPLHSTLSIADQDKVFGYAPEGVRKCIVSTNIAETSLTIDGIRFVIDSGKVKEMSYDPNCKMQKLKEFWISKASADQRKGRSGRCGPGVCYRLYAAEDYTSFEKFSTPELQRVPLDSSLLQMIAMGLPDPRKFPFIEPPPAESIENSILSLKEHGALSENEKLTSIGKTLARLPVDITIGKMLIMGSLFHQVEPILSLAAALSVQTPFTNKAYRDKECETSRKNLESDHGDPITLLNAYKEWLEVKHANIGEVRSGSSSSKKWCKRRGLEEQRFYEMTKLRTQFKDLLEDCKLLQSSHDNSEMTSSERIMRHGELKLLRSLKRTYKQNDSRKRKQLKIDEDSIEIDDEKDDGIDIKDVEFRMKNDYSKISSLVTASNACSYKDLMMLKLILCSGLYPQFAVADEFNYCKSMNEQLFHTKVKPFVALHPMSFFGNHHEVLHLTESDISEIHGFKSKTPISVKHQLLTYLSLLETTKPYLVNTLRIPAAQTLLLFSQEIDTDYTFTTLVCDSWLSLNFPAPDTGAMLLLKAANLRQKWDHLLNIRLGEKVKSEEENIDELEYELSKGLVEFMHTSVPYTIKRLLVADLKSIYVGCGENARILEPNPFSLDFECVLHERKGGVRVNKVITYNCLIASDWSDKVACEMMEVEWNCKICDFCGVLTTIEKLQHICSCNRNSKVDEVEKKSYVSSERKKNDIAYECSICQKVLYLTPTEILKHQKQHLS